MYRVAIVCEGPTDRVIIEAVLDHYLDDYEPVPIQPPIANIGGDAGPLGGGWKGVRTWCSQEATGPGGLSTILANADLLVIQTDADAASDPEISNVQPCPPPTDTADEVRALLLGWVGLQQVPERVVLCVPAMGSETWVLVGLFPDDSSTTPCTPLPPDGVCVECRFDVKSLLRRLGRRLQKKLVVSQRGQLKNRAAGYQAKQVMITQAWPRIVEVCLEASRFDTDLRAVLP